MKNNKYGYKTLRKRPDYSMESRYAQGAENTVEQVFEGVIGNQPMAYVVLGSHFGLMPDEEFVQMPVGAFAVLGPGATGVSPCACSELGNCLRDITVVSGGTIKDNKRLPRVLGGIYSYDDGEILVSTCGAEVFSCLRSAQRLDTLIRDGLRGRGTGPNGIGVDGLNNSEMVLGAGRINYRGLKLRRYFVYGLPGYRSDVWGKDSDTYRLLDFEVNSDGVPVSDLYSGDGFVQFCKNQYDYNTSGGLVGAQPSDLLEKAWELGMEPVIDPGERKDSSSVNISRRSLKNLGKGLWISGGIPYADGKWYW